MAAPAGKELHRLRSLDVLDIPQSSAGQSLVKFLSEGSPLIKVIAANKQYKRHFYFDVDRKYLYYKGSQKKRSLDAKYDMRDVIDVRKGYVSDVFNKLIGTYEENCCFSIIFGTTPKPLNLVAFSVKDCDDWVKGLRFVIKIQQELIKSEDERVWIADYFHSADTSEDGKLEFKEVWNLLQRMSVKMSKKEALAKFHAADADKVKDEKGKPTLTLEEFVTFFHKLCERPDIKEIFSRYLSIDVTDYTWDCTILHKFMIEDQKMHNISVEDCADVINAHEMNAKNKQRCVLSLDGFQSLLNSKKMGGIFNPAHEMVYQDMTQPLSHYFISSSHNTYLLEDQLRGPSSIEGYIRALMRGCRCVELDCWDGKDSEPIVYHGYTIVSKIKFKDIIEDAIKGYAFVYTDYPLILSLENHCSVEQQSKMAKYLKEILGDLLVTRIDPKLSLLPSPEALRGKILIKCRKLQGLTDEVVEEGTDEEEEKSQVENEESVMKAKTSKGSGKQRKLKMAKELSDLVTYVQSTPFKGYVLNHDAGNGKFCEISSFSEKFSPKLTTGYGSFVKHSEYQLCRVYPAARRTDSSNFSPVDHWNMGAQLVSLNWQTSDKWMQIYHGKFKDNGGSGYVLKPAFMRANMNSTGPNILQNINISSLPDGYGSGCTQGLDVSFNPKSIPPNETGKIVKVKIISGCHLPKPQCDKNTKDLVDPYVKLSIFGVEEDTQEFKTDNVWDNGLNPVWNTTFEFFLTVPELAIIRFLVKDFDKVSAGGNHEIAQYCIPFPNMMEGYRHIRLETLDGQTLGPTSLCLYIRITEGVRPSHLQNNKSRSFSVHNKGRDRLA